MGALLCIVVAGCGGANNGLSRTRTVELPDGTSVQTTLGSGVISFADSTWEFLQTGPAGQNVPFMTIRFGPDGELEAFENNTLASDIFGSTILFDGSRHPTSIQGVTYAAATYGAETADSTGFAFEGQLTGFLGGLTAASATATASGTFDGQDIDTVRGTFSFTSRMTLVSIPGGDLDLEFNFIGRRVTE